MPDTTERYQRIPRAQGPNLPRAPRNPRRPVPAGEPLGRYFRGPFEPELTELSTPTPFIRHHLHNLHNLPNLLNLPRASAANLPRAATHAESVKRHLRRPPASELQAPSRRTPCEPHQLTRPSRAQDQPRTPRRRSQHGHGQCVIIARHPPTSNVETMLVEPQSELRQVAEHAVPGAALERGGAAGTCQICARAPAQPRGHERQQPRAGPAPQAP